MSGLLLRLFVKDYRNTEDPKVRGAYGKLAGVVGIVCNLLLFAGKLIAGLLSGSVAITADAVNNLSDASSSLVTLLGFKLAERPADEEHPYGHARLEYLSGLAVAALIGFSRMYLFVHFPTDVMFGAVLGAALAVLTVWALNRLCDWLAARRAAQNGGGNPQA